MFLKYSYLASLVISLQNGSNIVKSYVIGELIVALNSRGKNKKYAVENQFNYKK